MLDAVGRRGEAGVHGGGGGLEEGVFVGDGGGEGCVWVGCGLCGGCVGGVESDHFVDGGGGEERWGVAVGVFGVHAFGEESAVEIDECGEVGEVAVAGLEESEGSGIVPFSEGEVAQEGPALAVEGYELCRGFEYLGIVVVGRKYDSKLHEQRACHRIDDGLGPPRGRCPPLLTLHAGTAVRRTPVNPVPTNGTNDHGRRSTDATVVPPFPAVGRPAARCRAATAVPRGLFHASPRPLVNGRRGVGGGLGRVGPAVLVEEDALLVVPVEGRRLVQERELGGLALLRVADTIDE